jgi:hypothetical protein
MAYQSKKKGLTVEAVELQQCARNRNSLPSSVPIGSPQASSDFPDSATPNRPIMASSTDAAFVEDADVDQELRSRNVTSRGTNVPLYLPNKSGATSPAIDSDNEDAPLLSPSRVDYGSTDSEADDPEEEEWPGEADFRHLPWWKRPSVRPTNAAGEKWMADSSRYSGYSPHS